MVQSQTGLSLLLLKLLYFVRNLQSLYKLPPGGTEPDWFIVVTAQVELEFAKGLKVKKGFYMMQLI